MEISQKLPLIPIFNNIVCPGLTSSGVASTRYLNNLIEKKFLTPGAQFIAIFHKNKFEFNDVGKIKVRNIVSAGTRVEVVSVEEGSEQNSSIRFELKGLTAVSLDFIQIDEEEGIVYTDYKDIVDHLVEREALVASETRLLEQFRRIKKIFPTLDAPRVPENISLSHRPYVYALYFYHTLDEVVELLKINDAIGRFDYVIEMLQKLNIEPTVDNQILRLTDENIQRSQKEYILRERAKAIRELLKEFDGGDADDKFIKAIEERPEDFPNYVKDRIKQEAFRLKTLGSNSQEASVSRTYLDLLIKMPWNKSTADNEDLQRVIDILDEDHFGLNKQKDRILEYLAVKTMTNSLKAPIICLYGPPGVGKTSLAISIARALDRRFIKFAVGGIYDESELRGHRRTYIGALPGRIISDISKCGSNNPVFLIDEIDKISGGGIHGDPAAALLEILDPEQNAHFEDHYLDMPFDLSKVLFICTANNINEVSPPLRDRLELIELNTYTLYEKLNIAKDHLVRQELKANGLTNEQIVFTDESLIYIIDNYTREAGVRELRRKINTIMRKFGVRYLKDKSLPLPFVVTKDVVEEHLKMPIFFHTHAMEGQTGIVNGLAYTSYGGEILPIEVNITKGKGNIIKTGNLGDVMKESVTIAFSYVRVLAEKYGYGPSYFEGHDFHLHVPEGAVPKDGPSAGTAISICLLSAILNIPLRSDVGMTGEVDLRGNSMQIGGLREKTLAAVREHLTKVLIPENNHNDVLELPEEITKNLQIVEVKTVEDIIPHIFMTVPQFHDVHEEENLESK